MHRAALRALAACASLTALASTLHAQPLTLAPPQYPAPAMAAPEPAPVQQASQQNMGGGFIEFLFRGSIQDQPGERYPQPQYAPQPPQYGSPQPQYAPRQPQPQYSAPQLQRAVPQPQYAAPQPQYAAPEPAPAVAQPEPAPARPLNPLEALFAPLMPQQSQQPQQQPPPVVATYDPDPENPGYREPGTRNPRAGVPSAVPRVDPARYPINPKFLKQSVPYAGKEPAGTIIIDTPNKFLYLVQGDGTALRYGVGVGRPGFTWAGVKTVSQKKEWPDWVPPPEMLDRQPDLPRHMAGGPKNPLGARAMYLGSTLYRIHGSNEPWTIGTNVSSGCIRMRNEDVIDLYERVKVGTKVVVI